LRAVTDSTTVDSTVLAPATGMTPLGYTGLHRLVDSMLDFHPVVGGRVVMRMDSVRAVVDSVVRLRLAAIRRLPADSAVRVLGARDYALAMAELSLITGDDTAAARWTREWSVVPIQPREHAIRLKLAVELWAGTTLAWNDELHIPAAHLAMAEQYQTQLTALPPDVSGQEPMWGHFALMKAYARNGEMSAASASGRRAMTVLAKIPDLRERLEEAGEYHVEGAIRTYISIVAGQPHGRAVLDTVLQGLRRAIQVEPAVLARDSGLAETFAYATQTVTRLIETTKIFGREAPPLVAVGWFNQPLPPGARDAVTGARSKRLDDGIIRVIEFGHFGCEWCARGRNAAVQWVQQLPRGVQFEYYDVAEPNFGGDRLLPDTMVARMKHVYVETRHYPYPIAVWAGMIDSTWDGGHSVRDTPNRDAFLIGSPSYVVIDGRGIIRWYTPGWSDDLWTRLTRDILPPLLKEKAVAQHGVSPAMHEATGDAVSTATPVAMQGVSSKGPIQ